MVLVGVGNEPHAWNGSSSDVLCIVGSADPTQDSVLIWTRVTTATGKVSAWEIDEFDERVILYFDSSGCNVELVRLGGCWRE